MASQQALEGMEALVPEPGDRRGFIGGSDVASIFGLSPWKSAYDLWEEKTAETYEPSVIEPQREKLYKRGKKLEPWVIEMLEEERGIYVVKRNQIHFDEEFPWMRCEVDFEYMGDAGICNGDVKTIHPFAANDWGEEGTDEIPTYYALQFLHGMMITKRTETMVAALIGADDLRVYTLKRDEELIAEIRRRVLEFWNVNVLGKLAPPPATISDTHKLLARYGGFVTAGSPHVCEMLRRLNGIKKATKRLKESGEKYELEIKQFLVDQAQVLGADDQKKFVINGPDGKKLASFAQQSRSGYTVEPTTFWVLRS